MRTLLILLSFVLVAPFNSGAQGLPIVVLEKKGKVKYQENPDGDWKKIKDGAVLERSGQLKMCKWSKLKLFSDGAYKEIEKTKKVDLASLFPEEQVSMGLMGFVAESVEDNTTDGATSGDEPKPVRDGFGDRDFFILPIKPFARMVPLELVEFKWTTQLHEPPYKFVLKNAEGKVVHEAEVMNRSVLLDLNKLGFKNGDQMQWMVSVKKDMGKRSPDITLTAVNQDSADEILKPLKQEKMYMESDDCVKLGLEAALLQNKKHYYTAMSKLEKARKECPKNEFIKQMYEGHKSHFGLDFK